MASPLGPKSMEKLKGVHPDLVRVVKRAVALSEVDFIVTEGVRSVAKQAQLVKAGASKTMNSRHLTGDAIDVAPLINGEVRWDWPPFYKIADAMKKAAAEEKVAIEWGGDWKTFRDGPHFQLPWPK